VGGEPPAGKPRARVASLRPGSRIAGYLLQEQVGQGGMAVVYLALDERLDRRVALKILTPAMSADEGFRLRFIRESKAAAAVDDPHIIPVFEAGEADGVLFIAMRYVPDGDVWSLIRRGGPLPADQAARVISQVASALDAAHRRGLVHRDVKPANMLVDSGEQGSRLEHVYLSDFGLTKGEPGATALTSAGQFLGTPAYIAPEQIHGRPVDGRADQYALACAAFEILSGSPPFPSDEPMAAILAHVSEPPPSLTSRRPDLPLATDAVLATAMAKEPGDRYASCGAFAAALRLALLPTSGQPPGAPAPLVGHSPTEIAGHGPGAQGGKRHRGAPATTASLGIDLGTTFSVVSQVAASGVPMVLPNAEGSPTTPSVVLFESAGVVVGAGARQSLVSEPESVVQLVKRQMGSDWTFDFHGVSYRPEHVSALILRKLHADAQKLAGPVGAAAITVPAYFNDTMRSATRRAGELAGLDVLGLLSEPTAAALAFGYDRRPQAATGVIIDLGGGTFDVTVMDYDGYELTVRATGGDAYLGGANFDKVIFDYFVERFREAHGIDIFDPDALNLDECSKVSQDWLLRAIAVKHDLTAREYSPTTLHAAGRRLLVEVDREEFVRRSRVLLDEIADKISEVVAAAGVRRGDINVVLAVGGATRIPAVRERVRDVLGLAPDTSVRPDEAVALGAAIFAAQRQLERGTIPPLDPDALDFLERLTVHDVAAHSIGVSVVNVAGPGATGPGATGPEAAVQRLMVPLLPRNTPLPVQASRSFYTLRPGETSITVPVLEGEERDPQMCRRLGQVVVSQLPPGRPPHQEVVVTMRLDRDAILRVTATDVSTGAAASTTIDRVDGGQQQVGDAADAAVRSMPIG
jgi:molecular chaperone DnaK (HSP70)/serine/threonine protein kinase